MTHIPRLWISMMALVAVCYSCGRMSAPYARSHVHTDMPDVPYFRTAPVELSFPDLSVFCNGGMGVEGSGYKIEIHRPDTVLDMEFGTSFDAATFRIRSTMVIDFKVSVAFKTCLSVQNEGPHCDLHEWLGYKSPDYRLRKNPSGYWVAQTFPDSLRGRFPTVSMEQVRSVVCFSCHPGFCELVDTATSLKQTLFNIGIGTYYLHIDGIRVSDGSPVRYTIVFIQPRGC